MPKLSLQVFSDVSWWHWAATIPVLAAHLAGFPLAIEGAMVLCGVVGTYFYYRLRQVRPYAVQVRLAYFGLLVAGGLPGMQWIHWTQLIGTTAMVTVGYCPLIRMLSLLPHNRSEPLSRALVWHAFVEEHRAGGLVEWTVPAGSQQLGCCSLPPQQVRAACSLPKTDGSLTAQGSYRVPSY